VISADSPPDHVTPYDRFAWSDTHVAELNAYFGSAEYRVLTRLARRAQRAAADPALRVFIVPGIMGSQLGLLRQPPLPHDIVWIDPIDIERGRLAALRLPGAARIVPLGVVLFSYLRLKLYLRAHGFPVEFHDYDWRLPVTQLGQAFAARLRSAAPTPVAIVAHSMGGLVTRAALAHLESSQVQRVLLLGTPNRGSFAAVQALRGTYAVVRKVARLVGSVSAETLTSEVFSSFPSLYDLLPCGLGSTDLFDLARWPTSAPRPRVELLQAARASHEQFAPADERFTVIAGVGEETVTGIARIRDEFVYTLTRHGDGTVPTSSATLAGARSAYARVAHSNLTRDPLVAAAVVDILRKGRTRRLPDSWSSASRARVRISDRQLRRSHADKVDWAALAPEQRRVFLENLNEPPHLKLRVPRAARRERR
jgi:pimeloyl-ACP methyl ester carboxylesterase